MSYNWDCFNGIIHKPYRWGDLLVLFLLVFRAITVGISWETGIVSCFSSSTGMMVMSDLPTRWYPPDNEIGLENPWILYILYTKYIYNYIYIYLPLTLRSWGRTPISPGFTWDISTVNRAKKQTLLGGHHHVGIQWDTGIISWNTKWDFNVLLIYLYVLISMDFQIGGVPKQ